MELTSVETLEQFDQFKQRFAKKLLEDKDELNISDVMALCQPLAAEGVTSEPELWSCFANIALSRNIEKLSLQDFLTLSWAFGKVQLELPADEDGCNFGNQNAFWKNVIEQGFTIEFREMRENEYRSENCLPVLSKICVALKEASQKPNLISERFWSNIS